MDKYAFGNRLCALRTEKGYTQEKLGRMLGVSNKAISKWENGTTQPRLQMLDKIAACFDISVEELLEYDGDNQEPVISKPKQEVSGIPDAIKQSPKLSIGFLMSIGWIKVDTPKFLSEIKKEYGLTNAEIASVFETSEKTIGLWENGLKQPNAVKRFRIAAFYYGNCEDKSIVTELTDSTGLYKSTRWLMILVSTFIAIYFNFVYYPLYVISDRLYYLDNAGTASPFSINGLFVFVIPNAILLCSLFMYIKYIRLNRPELEATNHSVRMMLLVVFVYLIADWLIFATPSYMLFAFTVFVLLAFSLHFIKSYKVMEFLGVALLLVFVGIISKYNNDLLNNSNQMFNPADEIILAPILLYSLIIMLEVSFFEITSYYKRIKQYFPKVEIENAIFNKHDYWWFAVALFVSVVYFLLLEVFRRELYIWFGTLPELP